MRGGQYSYMHRTGNQNILEIRNLESSKAGEIDFRVIIQEYGSRGRSVSESSQEEHAQWPQKSSAPKLT